MLLSSWRGVFWIFFTRLRVRERGEGGGGGGVVIMGGRKAIDCKQTRLGCVYDLGGVSLEVKSPCF